MEKIKSWEQRREEQKRKEKREVLSRIISVAIFMFSLMMFAVIPFSEAYNYKVAEKEDIKVVSAVVESVDFREYTSLTNEKEDAKWATVSTFYGEYYYDFFNEEKMEEDKKVLLHIAESGDKVKISFISKKVRSGEEHQFIVDIRDGEKVYFSLEDYNEYQGENRSKYMNIGYFISATTLIAGIIGMIIICKKSSSGEQYGKRNRKAD